MQWPSEKPGMTLQTDSYVPVGGRVSGGRFLLFSIKKCIFVNVVRGWGVGGERFARATTKYYKTIL